MFHGAVDLAFRDREGRWNLIVVADAQAGPARHRSPPPARGETARARGLGPIARGWLVRHGPDGTAHEEVVTEFNDVELDRAMAELIPGGLTVA